MRTEGAPEAVAVGKEPESRTFTLVLFLSGVIWGTRGMPTSVASNEYPEVDRFRGNGVEARAERFGFAGFSLVWAFASVPPGEVDVMLVAEPPYDQIEATQSYKQGKSVARTAVGRL